MKFLLVIMMALFMGTALADEVQIEISPSKPLAGETFQALFRIFTDSEDEPNITFSPSGVEVVGKSNQGISTRTVYANGRLTVSREITVVYDLMAPRVGTAYLRDIKVQLGAKTLRHNMLALNVLKEPQEVPVVFIKADVPKHSIYVGEGITVRYYLYSKAPIQNVDIKRYPKLNAFLKRFLQEADRSERVSVDGQLYLRNQIYAAKLFPEKAGDLKIDSMEVSVSYANVRHGDPFAAFGMGREIRTKIISSETVKINALPLPAPVPPNFTGLVGKHNFDIQFGQTKFIVNEPLEVKLTVTGGGALENLEAPDLIKHPALEEFESNGDLKIANADEATKTFDYTFLAKENFKIPASRPSLSYFDPASEKYVSVDIEVPEIEAAGGTALVTKKEENKNQQRMAPRDEGSSSVITKPKDIAGPLLTEGRDPRAWLPYLNAALAVLSLFLALGWVVKTGALKGPSSRAQVPASFRKGEFSLGDFTRWLAPVMQKTGKSPSAILRESDLDEATKTYFIDLLSANDYKDYASTKKRSEFNYNSGHFKRLGKYIESITDESSSQSS
jgi:hypothetical protein